MPSEPREYISYAHQNLPRQRIIECASQYNDVDMASLIGANEDNFPFLIRSSEDDYRLIFWNQYVGMVEQDDRDPVRLYATVQYLIECGYPVFESLAEAEDYAAAYRWPRKS